MARIELIHRINTAFSFDAIFSGEKTGRHRKQRSRGQKKPCFNFSARGNSYFRRLVLNISGILALLAAMSSGKSSINGSAIFILTLDSTAHPLQSKNA